MEFAISNSQQLRPNMPFQMNVGSSFYTVDRLKVFGAGGLVANIDGSRCPRVHYFFLLGEVQAHPWCKDRAS